MAFPDNEGASSVGGDDASNRLIERAPTPQVAEHPDQTTQGGVGESDSLSAIQPTQEEFFASNAEDIIREFANGDQPTISHDSVDMPWLVRVQMHTEYVYVAPDEAAGASLGEHGVRVEELSDSEDGENIEPQKPMAEQAPQHPNVGTERRSYPPQRPDHNGPTLPANVHVPLGPQQPVSTEPTEFGNVGNPYDSFRNRRASQPVRNRHPVGEPPFNLGPRQVFTSSSGQERPRVLPHRAQPGWTENYDDLSTIVPDYDEGLIIYPRPRDSQGGQPAVEDPAQTIRAPTSYETLTAANTRSGNPHAPGFTNDSSNLAANVGQQARRRPPFVHNPDNPLAQMIPVDASGHPIRPSTTRLPPRPGPLGLGTVGHRIRREDIPQLDPADDEDEESGGQQPQQPRPHHQAKAAIQPTGPDDYDDSDDEGPGPHRAKRQRRTSTVEGDDGKKKYEKRPGLARWEVATNNLQVRDPATGQWRDGVPHDSIRGLLLQNAGPVSQYRNPRARGRHPEDQTSFLAIARDWGLDRPNGWNRIIDQILYRFQREGYEPPAGLGNEPGYMMHNGRVVIDRLHHPIRDWPLIPATLSTKFEGGYMEAIRRLCAGIRVYDFWARMPAVANVSVSIGVTGLANRTERFRNLNGLAPWGLRSGANLLRDAIQARLSQADRATNSTRDFLGLTKEELAEAKAPNKESAATKAKSRTHQERIAKQKQAKGTQKLQSQRHDEQYEAEEDNTEGSFTAEDKNQSAEDEDHGDQQ